MTLTNSKPRIALITNHGYAGVNLPVGGAPDTGGQNFYVHALANSLEKIGYQVTIFTRGGFPFFNSQKIREGIEKMSDNIRYVYVQGGGSQFIRKEDIAIALDDEIDWISNFISSEAKELNIKPWEVYECINSHYWDAAIIADKLILRWKNQSKLPLKDIDNHVWTPHSLGVIKERNFKDKSEEIIKKLKFKERISNEEFVCDNTQLFCSTSPEILNNLISVHKVKSDNIFDFPPCIDDELFKPRTKDELTDVYEYLSNNSDISVDRLKKSKIIFETSRMDGTKRKDVLLSAFAEAIPELDKLDNETFLFIGGGPNSSPVFKELENQKTSIPKLEGRAFLLGFIPDEFISKIFSIPDLFVSASEMEGFGMSVSQAAAAKVAVISSDLIPFSTQYAKDSTIIVEAGNIKGFSDAIVQILSDDKIRKQYAEKLYEVAQTLNWDNTTKKFVEWYKLKRK